jgi:phosphatidylethanolamine-binding protein (PEBP) family uncharacterized protein
MTLLGRLLKNRRAGEAHLAWHRPNLQGSALLNLTSRHFDEGAAIPLEHCAKYVGGENRSPHLTWSSPPPATAQLLLVIEDVDVPMAKPAVHCVALVDPAVRDLAAGALAAKATTPGVRLLRSTVGRGYHGPAPIKGHGPHRYIFQLFALSAEVGSNADGPAPDRARPRDLLAAVTAPVLARGRLTGLFERR